MSEEYILKMKEISKSFSGVQVLKNVNFFVKPGTVHVLMGENGAGKSTLMKVLMGIHDDYNGDIYFKGERIVNLNIKHSLDIGISMIHQELAYVPELTVAENIFLGKEPKRFFININKNKIIDKTKSILNELDLKIDPRQKMKDLTVSERQMVEIAKAISYNSSIIIMDEPTSAISNREVDKLFEFINNIKKRGVSVIYISHKMDEIFEIGDEITILRDGEQVGSYNLEDITIEKLIAKMVGRDLDNVFPERKSELGPVVLSVHDLNQENNFYDINFELRKGEILGFAGMMGAGRTELMECVFGLTTPDSGKIKINNKPVSIRHPKEAMKLNIGFISEDRKTHGLMLDLSVKRNLTISNLEKCSNNGILSTKKENMIVDKSIKDLSIKVFDREQKVNQLSGGNQQKIVFGKTLLKGSDILILDEPTRGVDIGAKTEIYKLIKELADEGKSIIIVSSEMPELLGMSDRIIVLSQGHITGELKTKGTNQEEIMKLAVAYH